MRTFECQVCGRTVVTEHGQDEVCEGCGTEYNAWGQRLAPREQWGEETGETYADIISPRDPESLGYPYEDAAAEDIVSARLWRQDAKP